MVAGARCCQTQIERGSGMNIDVLFRIAGIGILISVLCIVLKQAQKQEQAEMLTLAGVVIVLIMVVQLMNQLFTTVRAVFNL
jgi:stage III sporulation protein AC